MCVGGGVYKLITISTVCEIHSQTKQWVGDLKMNGTVRDVSFTPDGQYLLSTGSELSML